MTCRSVVCRSIQLSYGRAEGAFAGLALLCQVGDLLFTQGQG